MAEADGRAPPAALLAAHGPTFDAIHVGAAAAALPQALVDALAPGGRMVLIGHVSNATCDLPLGYCIVNSVSVIGSDSC